MVTMIDAVTTTGCTGIYIDPGIIFKGANPHCRQRSGELDLLRLVLLPWGVKITC